MARQSTLFRACYRYESDQIKCIDENYGESPVEDYVQNRVSLLERVEGIEDAWIETNVTGEWRRIS